jgi:dTDP-glucose pyrophosphorylase
MRPGIHMDLETEWQKALLSMDATIEDAIRNLNESSLQIVMLVSENNALIGTITDGDVRRGLLKGLDLTSPVSQIFNPDALVTPPHMNRDVILHLMQANKLHQLPVVDERRCVVGLYLWDGLPVLGMKPNTMVIMAGGVGSRLRPHTETCPKPLLPVAGKPMLEHIIERAKNEGFERFIIAIHYLGDMIKKHFGHGERWDVQIDYLCESTPLGTAGALSLLKSLPEEPFLVTNADILTDLRYSELLDYHVQHAVAATMAVRRYESQNPFGVVQTKGINILGFEEKPIEHTYVNAGVYVLDPSSLAFLKREERCDMPSLFERLNQKNLRTIVYPVHEDWLDIGRPDDFEQAHRQLKSMRLEE